MAETSYSPLTPVAVYYDGNYFLHVSNYFNYVHERRSRISLRGLHEFIRHQVAQLEQSDYRLCPIVDTHFFRGRMFASDVNQRGDMLSFERSFDDILMAEGIIPHYLPVKYAYGKRMEKGTGVTLALEAFEQTFYKKYSVVVLIASDGDYAPLVRKLQSLGTRVMLLSWDFEYLDEDGNQIVTKTSQDLIEEVAYPISMHEIMEEKIPIEKSLLDQLFVNSNPERKSAKYYVSPVADEEYIENPDAPKHESTILSLKGGFGFIKFPPNNVFFHYTSLVDYDFNDLQVGDKVIFIMDQKESGRLIARRVQVIKEEM